MAACPQPGAAAEEGAATWHCCGAKKSLGPAGQGRETRLAEARELLRRGLPASPFPSCPLDGPCCYLVDKYTRKGMEQSDRIKMYFEMT